MVKRWKDKLLGGKGREWCVRKTRREEGSRGAYVVKFCSCWTMGSDDILAGALRMLGMRRKNARSEAR